MTANPVARIHLSHLRANFKEMQKRIHPAMLIPVVKANAYGHGAVAVSRCLVEEGAKLLAVARFHEAMELVDSGIETPILIFGRVFPQDIPQAVRAGFRLTVFGTPDIRWLNQLGGNIPVRVHAKVETGMGRVGALDADRAAFFDALKSAGNCIWEGLYSHFATADEKDKTYSREQLTKFRQVISQVKSAGIAPPLVHMANSAGILDLPESRFDACRSGISLYGHYPSRDVQFRVPLKQVMELSAPVAHIRRLPKGHSVSYGRRWKTPKETTIAVLPMGYADGLRRHLTGKIEVMIRGKKYPVVGTITMDQTMVDVGDDPVGVGDSVLIWGDTPDGSLQALDVAESMNTISYELTCGVSARVPRIIVD
ncbi:alanine racemase [Desulfosarcina sp. OttesenSCG-928-A07]|nr:alanine racemase [Desulfosarcina sp. OttesenSCG-928-G17]MDL2328367.1 alanine racemase [Desulfosarcina sp. OttesenSCG-928-A07]